MSQDVGILSKEAKERFTAATLHALLFRHYKYDRDDLFTPILFKDAKKHGLFFGRKLIGADGFVDDWAEPDTEDDKAFLEYQRLRSLGLPPSASRYGGFIGDRVQKIHKIHQDAFSAGLWDFTYLLERGAADEGFVISADYVAVDEINDLNALQVAIVARARGKLIDQVGDTNQTIFGFAGVEPTAIQGLPYDSMTTMDTSYRLTPPVAFAANRILHRPGYIKTHKTTGGLYSYEKQVRNILALIRNDPKAFGGVYILARTNHIKSKARENAAERSRIAAEAVTKTTDLEAGRIKLRGLTPFWKYRIINEDDVPRGYMSPDTVKINGAIKEGIRNIPGIEIYLDERMK